MPIKPSQALLAALALVAAPAFAQDNNAAPAPTPAPAEAPEAPAATAPSTDAPAAAPAAPAADAAAAPAEGAPAAEAANAEPQAGQYYVKATNNDWTTRCLKAEQGKDPCELYQLLKDGEGNSVAEMTLIPLKNSKDVAAGATLVAPLETDLIQGLGFAVGTGEARGYPFSFCAPVGCVSRLGFTQAELDTLKRGNEATLTLLPFGGDRENPVQLKLSLAGFTAAFDALSTYADEPAPATDAAPAAEAPAAEAPAN
ncbi:invasion associated locus B family protein [Paracoccus fontiphilus]|uniref:Invasion associated locus B family protein n=1 Tax=Paracoccus fontiphilus TaxID=1815556 RepID=A0ABV7IHY7_9RHOB|nr:invasion associated locus B family protein [Paracoccus fontiphilus]